MLFCHGLGKYNLCETSGSADDLRESQGLLTVRGKSRACFDREHAGDERALLWFPKAGQPIKTTMPRGLYDRPAYEGILEVSICR